jgi:hypothetical protein
VHFYETVSHTKQRTDTAGNLVRNHAIVTRLVNKDRQDTKCEVLTAVLLMPFRPTSKNYFNINSLNTEI